MLPLRVDAGGALSVWERWSLPRQYESSLPAARARLAQQRETAPVRVKDNQHMTFTEAAAEVLRQVGRPLHYKEITDIAIEKNLLSHVGKSPEVTMGARLAALLKKSTKDNPLVRVKPGVFALREWDEKGTHEGAGTKLSPVPSQPAEAVIETESAEAAEESEPSEAAAAQPAQPERIQERVSITYPDIVEEEEEVERAPDEVRRAEIAAAGAELFGAEEDDDRPIFGDEEEEAVPAGGESSSSRRRRRRRRRRGANGEGAAAAPQAGLPGLPSYTEAPAFTAAPLAPVVEIEVAEVEPAAEQAPLEELAGRELADSVAQVLASMDRNGGTVSLRHVAEQAQRRGRVTGDLHHVQAQVGAAVRADNARRAANGQRLRFRIVGGRIALTDWSLTGELARLEAEAMAAVERYRDASRRALLRKLQELPGHALIELVLLALERAGLTQIRMVKRSGVPGSESHFSAVQKTGAGEVKTAIVIRRDGREIGRERVADLRGSLHHYGPAAAGWIITTGQVLSGAREESATASAAPIALYDGIALARLCEDNEVAVLRARLPIALPDVDFLEALRAT